MNNNWKNKAWKFATIFVVLLVLLNPELIELALFIDAIGLESFLMLLEMQILAMISALFIKSKNLLTHLKYFCLRHIRPVLWKNIRKVADNLLLVTHSPAILMHMLVFSAAIDVAFKVWY